MEELIKAIHTTPIIDNHAHPLLKAEAQAKYPLLAITTEAHGDAMKATTSALSHIRAVKQLSEILGCDEKWEDVVQAIETEKSKPDDAWTKRCLEGIETILVDDGLDGKDEVFDYAWHDEFTRSNCKRIVRIEKVAEEIIDGLLGSTTGVKRYFPILMELFQQKILDAISDPEVVGFKSVICYRTGLNIPFVLDRDEVDSEFRRFLIGMDDEAVKNFNRIDGQPLNAYLVHETAKLIQNSTSKHKKPFQFHTGLGDNDITLTRSSPSHLQEFIRAYPEVPIVLLHASYPWTKEAGYLASVYKNVYADIGEVFPFLSKEGQENVIREILELCPTQKVLWSTDGHWFPETYLLAIIQVREALEVVLSDYVRNGTLSVPQAIKVVEDIFFKTSNDLYDLKLPLEELPLLAHTALNTESTLPPDLETLNTFLENNPATKFLRLQYLDYTATPRLRVIPVKRALTVLQNNRNLSINITKSCLGLLQNDTFVPQVTATGEYKLEAIFSSLRTGPSYNYASIQCVFREADGSEVDLCPRSICRRVIQAAESHGLEFLLGFEIEIVFISQQTPAGPYTVPAELSRGHVWSSARGLHSDLSLRLLDDIYEALAATGIDLEQFHPESADGQFEFVLPALPPLEAVDTLLHAREIITSVAETHGLRATLIPKPFPMQAGTATHAHISILPLKNANKEVYVQIYEAFYAGILKHLRAILAFTYSNPASYDRMADGCWAGGSWVAWGSQNRETALRKVEGSHWEIKVLDGLANMYLAIAAFIAVGTQGVARREKLLLKDCTIDPANLSEEDRKALNIDSRLPKDLKEAMDALDKDQELRELLGDAVIDRYIDVKAGEMKILDVMNADERREWIIERY